MAGAEAEGLEAASASVAETRDQLLRALQKLNDRSTQERGVAELHELIQARCPDPRPALRPRRCADPLGDRRLLAQKQLDFETLIFLVSALVQPGSLGPGARRESVRLLATLTSEDACPLALRVFQHAATLAKLCQCVSAGHQGPAPARARPAACWR